MMNVERLKKYVTRLGHTVTQEFPATPDTDAVIALKAGYGIQVCLGGMLVYRLLKYKGFMPLKEAGTLYELDAIIGTVEA